VAWALGNLASPYVKQGRHADAEQLYERALAIHAQVRNPEHAELAMSLNALVELYAQQGRYHDAEPLLQKVLTIREKLLGPGHEETLETRERLAALQQALKSGES
jgi:tetratricopeptide (TPR) repeat protein